MTKSTKIRFKFNYLLYSAALGLTILTATACTGGAQPIATSSNAPGTAGAAGPLSTGSASTSAALASGLPGPSPTARSWQTDVLLFTGQGTWSSEIASIENILTSHGATFQDIGSTELNAMTVDEIAQYGVMIFPGGEGGTEAGSLSAQTHANLREAVQLRGVSYVGFCAGSFIAVAPAPVGNQDVSYGLGIVNGPLLQYYYLENQGTDIAMTEETFADGTQADLLWYGGPVTPDTPGGVIARYPTGEPAMSEMWSGRGFVVLSAVHPTATQAILDALGMTSNDGTHTDIAWNLINGALHQAPLPAFK